MIGIIFHYGGEVVETRIKGTTIYFRTSTYGSQFVPIENIHISKEGALKKFPDLAGDELWRQKAIERFKNEMKVLNNESKVADYVVKELSSIGYIPKYRQREGHRPEVINGS